MPHRGRLRLRAYPPFTRKSDIFANKTQSFVSTKSQIADAAHDLIEPGVLVDLFDKGVVFEVVGGNKL